MNALLGYASSDDEDEIQPPKPAKIAKLDGNVPNVLTQPLKAPTAHPEARIETQPLKASTIDPPAQQHENASAVVVELPPPDAPVPGPSAAPIEAPAASPGNPPLSPYTYTRQRLRELTMPPVPSFDIPSSPPPPERNSEAAAALAATTKQFERFLELKKQGVHFNARLQSSNSLRNPSLLPKLVAFAGMEGDEQYKSTLSEELGVPSKWPESSYVENLLKLSEKREKKKMGEREKVDFVPAAQTVEGSAGGGRRSRFDKT